MDPSASIPARVHDLLGRMTLKEKVGQMDQAVVGLLRDKTNPANGVCNGDNTSQPQPNCLQNRAGHRRHRLGPVGWDRQSAR